MKSLPFEKEFVNKIFKKYWPYLLLVVFWLFVVWPWFAHSGFLLLLDFIPVPEVIRPSLPWQSLYISGLLFRWPYWLLSQVMPVSAAHKVMFSLPLAIAGISMYQLCCWLLRGHQRFLQFSSVIAALFYSYNPFVTTRVFMGHILFIYAYALLPWVVLAWLKFQQKPSPKQAIFLFLLTVAALLFSPHHFIILPLLLLLLFIPVWPRPISNKRSWLILLILFTLAIVLTLATFYFSSTRPNPLNPLGPWSRTLLAPYSGYYVFDVLNLSATWKINLPFLVPWDLRPFFGLVSFLLLIIMASGLWWLHHQSDTKKLSIRLLLVVFISSFLATGVAHPLTSPLSGWLYQHVPFWLGMRDSAKFLSLLAFTESLLLAAGVIFLASLWERFNRHRTAFIVPVVILCLVFYIASTALYGYNNQIYPLSYPNSWQQAQSWFKNNHLQQPNVLFLPWHMYLSFSFTNDRTIANPARAYFTAASVFIGNNNEVGGTFGRPFISAENTDPEHQYVQDVLLTPASPLTNFGTLLAPLCIEYIMLATDTRDVVNYNFLYSQKDLTIVFSQPDLTIWRNLAVNLPCVKTIR